MVQIPEEYWLGNKCIETRTPWLVPESICALDRWLTKDDTVLEFGCGGSTLFFADRCKEVISIDTCQDWINKIQACGNVKSHCVSINNAAVEANSLLLDTYKDYRFNVVNIDWDLQRDFFQPHVVQFLMDRFVVILDNYTGEKLFPVYYNKEYMTVRAHCQTYDDTHWYGSGTKIYSNEPLMWYC